MPIIFCGEFDTMYNSKPLGWLKYFLEPMEGKNSAIFIFAGGTSHTYKSFSHDGTEISEKDGASFRAAKGPDFVSRLRGHINILGPNRVDQFDDGYIVRRAVILRSMLVNMLKSKKGMMSEVDDNISMEQQISNNIIHAMLNISSFKHGARSMRAVIHMCDRLGQDDIGKCVSSTLPIIEQLDMHVN